MAVPTTTRIAPTTATTRFASRRTGVASKVASTSAMCMPHTGSRTSFRVIASFGTSTGACDCAAPCPMRCTRRRSNATPQETTTTQNTNRSKRAINVISGCECGRRLTRPFYPLDGVEASVCRGPRGVKQKAVLSRGCAAKGSPEANTRRRSKGLHLIAYKRVTHLGPQSPWRGVPGYLPAGIRSTPIYGRSTSGITIEPSACW